MHVYICENFGKLVFTKGKDMYRESLFPEIIPNC